MSAERFIMWYAERARCSRDVAKEKLCKIKYTHPNLYDTILIEYNEYKFRKENNIDSKTYVTKMLSTSIIPQSEMAFTTFTTYMSDESNIPSTSNKKPKKNKYGG